MGIDDLISAAVRCVRCGAQGVGTCLCWNAPRVTLSCPRCKRKARVERIDSDPPGGVYELRCPECADREGDPEADVDLNAWVGCEAVFGGNRKIRCSMVAGDGHGPNHKRITKTGRVTHAWPAEGTEEMSPEFLKQFESTNQPGPPPASLTAAVERSIARRRSVLPNAVAPKDGSG